MRRPLAPEVVAEIRQALLAHKVIFFRGQHLDHASQVAFARQFGELTHAHPHEDAPPEEAPEILTIDPRRYEKRYGSSYAEQYTKRQYTYFAGWHLLFEQIARPDYTVRFHWEPGSVAFWDNRATAHLGPTDLGHLNVERVLHRVTLIGDRPVGPTGFTSEIVEGKPFLSNAEVKVG